MDKKDSSDTPYGITKEHLDFASPAQADVVKLVLAGHSAQTIAKMVDRAPDAVRRQLCRVREKARRYGFDPATGATAVQYNPVRGQSVLTKKVVDEEGNALDVEVLRWTKTDRSSEEMIAEAREVIAALSEEIPKAEPVALPEAHRREDLLNAHALADYHLGMFSERWSTEEAEEFLLAWFSLAIEQAPPAKTGLLLQLGDFMHFDGILPVTPESGHVLDADARYSTVVRVAVRTLRRIVQMMLEKYERVVLVMSEGNHDPSGSVWLREAIAALYENEPRIEVDTSPSPYHAYRFGNVALFTHHGHRRPPRQVDQVFASMFREIYGACEHSYAHLGHRHSREVRESNLMVVEQHATMAPKDDYAASRGYHSRRAADVITYHREFGEVGRQKISAEMV